MTIILKLILHTIFRNKKTKQLQRRLNDMKNLFKHLFLAMTALVILTVPTLADTKLKDDEPLYTINEAFTAEEQACFDTMLNYFVQNPNAETLTLSSRDFPSLSMSWVNDVILQKVTFLTNVYAYNPSDQSGAGGYFSNFPIWAHYQCNYQDHVEVTIKNYNVKDLLQIHDFLVHTYSLLPSIGIKDGMDEREAIEILNNWECDLLSRSESGWTRYLTIYSRESKGGLCLDYAMMFRALCRGAGIEAYMVVSNAANHGWNEVVIDGQRYEIDVFHNDLKQFGSRHYCFLLTREQCSKLKYHKSFDSRY